MILVQDNYLPTRSFKGLQEEVNDTHFEIVKAGDKEFLCMETPNWLYENLKIEDHRIVFTFIRKAKADFDIEPRIHADNIIAGERVDLASVLYINNSKGVTPNGTAFWDHYKHGYELSEDVTPEEFDRLLLEDSNQNENFIMTDKIIARPNRLLVYNAQFFHSKWPFHIKQGERIICATFYKKI